MAANGDKTTDEVREATAPHGAQSNGGSAPITTAAKSSDPVAGLNVPVLPEYTLHEKLHVSHRGQYSIERLLALYDYTQRVSTIRAIAVCVLTPAPAIMIAIVLQLLPLHHYNPFQWANDPPFWILTSVLSAIFALSVTLQARAMLPTYPISFIKGTIITLVTAAAMVVLLAFAGWWMFPVPFTFVLGMAPFLVVWLVLFGLLVRPKPSPDHTTAIVMPLRRFVAFLIVQMVAIVTFAAFEMLLVYLTPKVLAKKLTFLLYQQIRNILKQTAACYLLRHAQDFVPELLCFSIELFVALYMLFEMRVAYEFEPTSAILGTVFLTSLGSIIDLGKRLNKLKALRAQAQLPPNGREALDVLVDALKKPDTLDESVLKSMRLRATGGHTLPTELAAIVDTLETMAAFQPAPASAKPSGASRGAVVPAEPIASGTTTSETANALTRTLHQSLVVLFHSEYVILIKYVEIIVPIIYVIFVVVIADANLANLASFPAFVILRLPAMAHFHTHIIAFSGLMLLMALVMTALHATLLHCKQAGVGALQQLAFVLEHQQLQIQAKLIAYVLLAVHFVMLQYGADFQGMFAWKAFFKHG